MFINENFLSFIWKFQYFDHSGLSTQFGDLVNVLSPGILNPDEGPDFTQASLHIADVYWYGNIEVHVNASHWNLHHHEKNPKFDNVILHVVWENDSEIRRSDGTVIPAVELKDRVDKQLLFRYHSLVNNENKLLCSRHLGRIHGIHLANMLDKALIERLKDKSAEIMTLFEMAEKSWEETSYRLLMKNFGFKINQHEMLVLATNLPYKILKKHLDNPVQVEALLFGTAGLLIGRKIDDYHSKLFSEYEFLKAKYGLKKNFLTRYNWKFMRTHPANFPTIRIAQFAAFISTIDNLFSLILDKESKQEWEHLFNYTPNEYWQNHYDFGKKWKIKSGFGKDSVSNILINTFAPVLVAYGSYSGRQELIDEAVMMLEQIKPESNKNIRIWKKENIIPRHAGESQALLQLYNKYCFKKRCLNCNIGVNILKPENVSLVN